MEWKLLRVNDTERATKARAIIDVVCFRPCLLSLLPFPSPWHHLYSFDPTVCQRRQRLPGKHPGRNAYKDHKRVPFRRDPGHYLRQCIGGAHWGHARQLLSPVLLAPWDQHHYLRLWIQQRTRDERHGASLGQTEQDHYARSGTTGQKHNLTTTINVPLATHQRGLLQTKLLVYKRRRPYKSPRTEPSAHYSPNQKK